MSFRKISIVTPTYNQGQYIEQTIQSVLDQGYPNLEYVIIDGGSTDNTVEVIKKYEKHLSYWVSEPDQGQTHAINKGFSKTNGEIFNWLNSDDYYQDGALHKVNTYFSKEEVDVLLGKSILFKDDSDWKKVSKGGHLHEEVERTIGDSLIDQPSSFFRHSVFKNLSPLEVHAHYLMDRLLWMRYLLCEGQKRVLKVDDEFVNFRLHNSSKSVSENVGFNRERNGIFLSLADYTNASDMHEVIKTKLDFTSLPIQWPEVKSEINADIIFAEFLLVNAREEYALFHYKSAKDILKSVMFNSLTKSSQKDYSLLKKKLLLPKKVLRWVRKRS
jgi:glycosyltransferase involved in cell wall biosynthesis